MSERNEGRSVTVEVGASSTFLLWHLKRVLLCVVLPLGPGLQTPNTF